MARFASTRQLARPGPTSIGTRPNPTYTFEGGAGWDPSDPHAELFSACVSGFLADGFYESGDRRVERLEALVAKCDPEWLAPFARWLRHSAGMRSAPIVIAAQYAANGFPNSRSVISSVLARPDEPGELLAYWKARVRPSIKSSVKRGIADAIVGQPDTGYPPKGALYTERSAFKYDSGAWRFGDVIELVHPKPHRHETQDVLFRWLLDRRRHSDEMAPPILREAQAIQKFERVPEGQRRALLASEGLPKGVTWERVAGWLPGGMDREAWEAVLPQMGYMALVRNLNNFDRNGVDPKPVIERLTNPDSIRKSRMLPFRFLTAYQALEGDNYKVPLADAADVAVENLPSFAGNTLIMVDCSGSMMDPVGSGRSRLPISLSQLAGFMAESLGRRCDRAVIACYSNDVLSAEEPKRHVSIVRAASDPRYQPVGGTYTWRCTQAAFNGIDVDFGRVVIITDEQAHDSPIDLGVPVVSWNVAGYQQAHAPHGSHNLIRVSGVSDQVMRVLPDLVNLNGRGQWPWENTD